MGIEFTGHPWLRRILMPDNWVGHPLRKDYPLGGELVYFTSDADNPRFSHLGRRIMEGPSYPSELPEGVDSETHLVINMGPQHPATHGVLRLAVELDGERIVSVNPDVGYLHSGFEKTGENKRYEKFIPYTDRLDYLAPMRVTTYCQSRRLVGDSRPRREWHHSQPADVLFARPGENP
jgi:hypothetical protein